MKITNHSIIGSGLSSLIKFQIQPNSIVFSTNEKKNLKSLRFYENLGIGGNTNIWGGYINYKMYKFFLKNKKFDKFLKNQKIFRLRKLFSNRKFNSTYYISNYLDNKIFRINKKHFKNCLIKKKIKKLSIKNEIITMHTDKKKIQTKNLSICVGNFSLLKLLYNSKLIKLEDKINFFDGDVNYGLNFLIDKKNSYYIPMTIFEIAEKLIKGKKTKYNKKINNTLFVQKFSKKYKRYSYRVENIFNPTKNFTRFFLSNHITNLSVNNVPINEFIKKYSSKISIYNSGAIRNYLAGPISQNLIFNAVTK